MYKKLLMAFAALTALAAFALPATASATNEPTLKEGATHVAVGTKIVGTNIGNTVFWNTATTTKQVECTKAVMTGTLLANAGDEIEGTIETATFTGTGVGGDCTGGFGDIKVEVTTPLCIWSDKTMATDEFQVEGSDCKGTLAPVEFVFNSTSIGKCEYHTTGTVKGDYTTSPGEARLTVRDTAGGSGSTKTTGSFLCPSSGVMQMTFNLETHNGEELTIVDTTP